MKKAKGVWTVGVREEFSAAHRLENYGGKCEALHGHNYTVEAEVEGTATDPATGLLLDFKDLRGHLKAVLAGLDHHFLNEAPCLEGVNPSSEHLARYIFGALGKLLGHLPVRLVTVRVFEKPGQWAAWRDA